MSKLDPPISDAYIILENLETGKRYVYKTDKSGYCRLSVEPGTYKIIVAHKDFMCYEDIISVTTQPNPEFKVEIVALAVDIILSETVFRTERMIDMVTTVTDIVVPETVFSIEIESG